MSENERRSAELGENEKEKGEVKKIRPSKWREISSFEIDKKETLPFILKKIENKGIFRQV